MFKEISYNSLSNIDFEKLSRFIHEQSGIKMPSVKKVMMEARLRKRLKELNISSYSEYCKFLFSREGIETEIVHLVDVITTNKTDFFREPKQFDFLLEIALPELINNSDIGTKRPLKVWSAGCSTGEEPYTISIVLNEFTQKTPGYSFNIFATDISTIVLRKAVAGIYNEDRIQPIEQKLVNKYFLRSKDRKKKLVRVIPSLRTSVNFQRLNFMDDNFGIREKFDIIFCRNVIIYFDKQTQDKLISNLLKHLRPGGYFFLGHSESIFNMDLPLVQLAASTYRKLK
jgi:chemotaxis protein methyltransferase CheR